ncbi:MAG: copper chaperone PCu(A)C [Pseudomonadales bacterium]
MLRIGLSPLRHRPLSAEVRLPDGVGLPSPFTNGNRNQLGPMPRMIVTVASAPELISRLGRTILTAALLAWSVSATAGPNDLHFDNARIRALIPGQDKTVGYFEVRNEGRQDVELVAVNAASARAAEFHTVVRDGDIMRMRRLEQVIVPAGGTLSFVPGGNHLMLFGVTSLTEQNPVTFTTHTGEEVVLSFRQIPVGATQ